MSKKSLLETGAIYEVYLSESNRIRTRCDDKLSGFGFESRCVTYLSFVHFLENLLLFLVKKWMEKAINFQIVKVQPHGVA